MELGPTCTQNHDGHTVVRSDKEPTIKVVGGVSILALGCIRDLPEHELTTPEEAVGASEKTAP